MAYTDVALLLALTLTVVVAYPTKDDEGYYNRLHEFQDSYGKDVRNLDGIGARDEANPLLTFLSKTQSGEQETGPRLYTLGSSTHLDGIGGGHLVRDYELGQGLEPVVHVMTDRDVLEYPGPFGVVRRYPQYQSPELSGDSWMKVNNPEKNDVVLSCYANDRCDGGSYTNMKIKSDDNRVMKNPLVHKYPDALGEGYSLSIERSIDSIGGGHLLKLRELHPSSESNFRDSKYRELNKKLKLNYVKDLDSIGGGHLLSSKKDLDSIGGGHLLNYKKDLDSIGGGHLLNYKKDLDSIGGGHLLNYKKDLDSIGGGHLLNYKKDLDSIGGGHLLNYKKDLDSIGGGHLLNYKKDLDSIGGGHLLNYKKDLDSIGGGYLLNYKKDLDSIGGGHLLNYKKDLDSIGGGHFLNYEKDLDSVGGGNLFSYEKDLDSIGGGHLLSYKKDLDSIGGGHLLSYKKDLDSIGGGHLLTYKKDLDSIGGGHLLTYKKDLDSIGGGHLLSYKKDLDSIGGGHLLTYKKDLDSIGGEHLLKKDLDSLGREHLLNYNKALDFIGGKNLLNIKKDLDSLGGGPLLSEKRYLSSLNGYTFDKNINKVLTESGFKHSRSPNTYQKYSIGSVLPLQYSRPSCVNSSWFEKFLKNYLAREELKNNLKNIFKNNKLHEFVEDSEEKNVKFKVDTPSWVNVGVRNDGINDWMKGSSGDLRQTAWEDQTEPPFRGIIEMNKLYLPSVATRNSG